MSHTIYCPAARGYTLCNCAERTMNSDGTPIPLPSRLRQNHSHRMDGMAEAWGIPQGPCDACEAADTIERLTKERDELLGRVEKAEAEKDVALAKLAKYQGEPIPDPETGMTPVELADFANAVLLQNANLKAELAQLRARLAERGEAATKPIGDLGRTERPRENGNPGSTPGVPSIPKDVANGAWPCRHGDPDGDRIEELEMQVAFQERIIQEAERCGFIRIQTFPPKAKSPDDTEGGGGGATTAPTDLYDRVEAWQVRFLDHAAKGVNGIPCYYRDAASGLAIALQEIDRERYDRTSGKIWSEYQEALGDKSDTTKRFDPLRDPSDEEAQSVFCGLIQYDRDPGILRSLKDRLIEGFLATRRKEQAS